MTDSILLSTTPDRYQCRRKFTRAETDPVSHKHQYVLALHLAGKKVHEIEKETGYSPGWIYKILALPNVVALRQQIQSSLDDEFSALQGKVNDTIRDALDSPDLKIALEGADKWLKVMGKYAKKEGMSVNVTAEDLVLQIMNGGQTQINNG